MVTLSIHSSNKINTGSKYFPFSGFLGLTPIKLEGCMFSLSLDALTLTTLPVVCTRIGSDHKLLPAKSISLSVRCYETRIRRVGLLTSNLLLDYSHSLWSKPDAKDYDEIGDLDFPFRISLPPNVQGLSTLTFPDYRVFWRIEASMYTPHNL